MPLSLTLLWEGMELNPEFLPIFLLKVPLAVPIYYTAQHHIPEDFNLTKVTLMVK
jgi:hypothetical protein